MNIELGYCYRSDAVIPDEGREAPAHENPRESKGRPGTRAPHVWLDRDGRKLSSLDFFGRRFVLLAGCGGGAWRDAAQGAIRDSGIDLDVHVVGDGKVDDCGVFPGAYGIPPDGAVLVRPDGFVGWRSNRGAFRRPFGETLARALMILTGREQHD